MNLDRENAFTLRICARPLFPLQALGDLLGISNGDQLVEHHRQWVEEVLKSGSNTHDAKWSESIAVGDKKFVAEVKSNKT